MNLRIKGGWIVTTLAMFFKHVDLDPMSVYKVTFKPNGVETWTGHMFVNSLHEAPEVFTHGMDMPIPIYNLHTLEIIKKVDTLK